MGASSAEHAVAEARRASFGPFVLTTKRLMFNVDEGNQRVYVSFPVGQVQWVRLEHRSQPGYLILASVLVMLAMGAFASDSTLTAMAFGGAAMLSLLLYFVSRSQVLSAGAGTQKCEAHVGGSPEHVAAAQAFLGHVEAILVGFR